MDRIPSARRLGHAIDTTVKLFAELAETLIRAHQVVCQAAEIRRRVRATREQSPALRRLLCRVRGDGQRGRPPAEGSGPGPRPPGEGS